jgi:hypothetical protein
MSLFFFSPSPYGIPSRTRCVCDFCFNKANAMYYVKPSPEFNLGLILSSSPLINRQRYRLPTALPSDLVWTTSRCGDRYEIYEHTTGSTDGGGSSGIPTLVVIYDLQEKRFINVLHPFVCNSVEPPCHPVSVCNLWLFSYRDCNPNREPMNVHTWIDGQVMTAYYEPVCDYDFIGCITSSFSADDRWRTPLYSQKLSAADLSTVWHYQHDDVLRELYLYLYPPPCTTLNIGIGIKPRPGRRRARILPNGFCLGVQSRASLSVPHRECIEIQVDVFAHGYRLYIIGTDDGQQTKMGWWIQIELSPREFDTIS